MTKARFQQEIGESDVIHFAGHAHFDVVDPMASGLELSDGRLTAREIFELDAATLRFVVLSACKTGFNDVQPGDELIGLTRAFLYLSSTRCRHLNSRHLHHASSGVAAHGSSPQKRSVDVDACPR